MLRNLTKAQLYKFLGWILFAWYACLRWTIQSNTLGTFVTDKGVTKFVLEWIFTPINLATAFLSIYFISKVLVKFDKAFNPLMALIAFFLVVRNGYYTLEDYSYYIVEPTMKQSFFLVIDIAMVMYVLIWAIIYWSMNRCKK
jgi:hypothetical protein